MDNRLILEQQLTSLVELSARKLNLKKYSFDLNLNAEKGDGLLGEIFKVAITDQETNLKIHLVAKKAPVDEATRSQVPYPMFYKNEIYFYNTVFPTLDKFQKERGITGIFDNIPEYITSNGEIGGESIVFKDLTFDGFVLRDRDLLLDDQLTRYIFSNYGRYHALSFALKDQDFGVYSRLIEPITDAYKEFAPAETFRARLKKTVNRAVEALDPRTEIYKRCQEFAEKCPEIYQNKIDYKGTYSGILHGDCWSNNMMFKYQDNSKLQDVKLLDFQLMKVGTPVYDLSYFFYTGGKKELFDKLEDYLDVYYESFSESIRKLGSNPQKLLPRKVLSEDWKEYSHFGILMALQLVRMKLTSKEDVVDALDGSINHVLDSIRAAKINEELFDERVRDIWEHVCEIGVL